ncbi:hypothetical protein B0J13DRAFT_564521 [Dactylonectria estremocensis]|uniref:Uncharacterized protein n=1 Tax=Dactylonectria estremocensis TaxID=1079267 RepID=A0A9P9DWH8_9HYPO|nr:hypothetical protein B0J13DRAFT_564521 [Dactylonectria estremocensis]
MSVEFVYTNASKNKSIGMLGPYSADENYRSHSPSRASRLSSSINGPGGETITDVLIRVPRGVLKIGINYRQEVSLSPPRRAEYWDSHVVLLHPSGFTIIGFYLV